jgi:hypothetical protein
MSPPAAGAEGFAGIAQDARAACPLSKALAAAPSRSTPASDTAWPPRRAALVAQGSGVEVTGG